VLAEYNRSVVCFEGALRIQPDFEAASKRRHAVLCHSKLENVLETQHRSVLSLTVSMILLPSVHEKERACLKNCCCIGQSVVRIVVLGAIGLLAKLCLHYLQCFDAVGWAAGRTSSLYKTEWWGAGVAVCLEQGAELHMAQLMPLPLTVASAGPYASLHFTPDRQPCQHPTTVHTCVSGWMRSLTGLQSTCSFFTFTCIL